MDNIYYIRWRWHRNNIIILILISTLLASSCSKKDNPIIEALGNQNKDVVIASEEVELESESGLESELASESESGLKTKLETALAPEIESKSASDKVAESKPPFSDLYYYEADKEARYAAYQDKHPDMPMDEVVWRVNTYLNYEFYTFDVPASLDDLYILVNKYYFVPEDYEPKDMIEGVDGYRMSQEVDEAFREMRDDIAKEIDGKIRVVSAWRSVAYQKDLFNRYLAEDKLENVLRYSAKAGYSEHHTGLAIDIVGSKGSLRDFINTKEGPWVHENAHKYGFIIRYTEDIEDITGYESEPWHLRYIGAPAASFMKSKGTRSFEEYKVKYIDHFPDNVETG